MIDRQRVILVFGATGRQGGAAAHALLADDWNVRVLVRDPAASKAKALAAAGVDVVEGSMADPDAIRRAMRGVYGVFGVLPADLAGDGEVQAGKTIADMAVKAGVNHFVYSSGASVSAELTGIPRMDAKPRIEAHLRTLPMTITILRPMIFMEMLTQIDEGHLVSLVRPDQTMQVIAVRDIGRFVANIFADRDQFQGKTITIAGDAVTGHGLALLFSETRHRTITYSRLPDAAFAANPDLMHIARSLDHGPLSQPVDLAEMRRIVPDLLSVADWLKTEGGVLLSEAQRQQDDID